MTSRAPMIPGPRTPHRLDRDGPHTLGQRLLPPHLRPRRPLRRRRVLGLRADLVLCAVLTATVLLGAEGLVDHLTRLRVDHTAPVIAGQSVPPWPMSGAAKPGEQVVTDQGDAVFDGARWVFCPFGWAEDACHLPE
jgi:hypothetical protein